MNLSSLLLALIGVVTSLGGSFDSTDFESDWVGSPPRTWVGPAFWANRLQDWRLADGRVECIEQADAFPLRTLMLLTREVEATDGELEVEVTVAPVDTGPLDEEAGPRGWAGVLLGAGGADVDYRISAQVHHRPAADGGLIVAVDRFGVLQVFDNQRSVGAGGSWSIGGALRKGELASLASAIPLGEYVPHDALALSVTVVSEGGRALLEARANDAATGELVSTLTLRDLPTSDVDGLFGLVSHLGPADGRAGFAFSEFRATGSLLRAEPKRSFGPVLGLQYTVSNGVLKLSAQLGPIGPLDSKLATLEVLDRTGHWVPAAEAAVDPDAFTALFRVETWDASRAQDFRVVYDLVRGAGQTERTYTHGHVPAEPDSHARDVIVASLNCAKHYVGNLAWNGSSIWFPHVEVVAHVRAQDPDLLYFAGDQLYEGDLDPADTRSEEKLILDYLYKWSRWCWSFGELTRNLPTVTIPDDHDVYQGNLWGAGGRAGVADKERGISRQDAGGYVHPPRFVNVVHRTQTSHLPDPVDPAPSGQGISVYFTELDYAGLSFAILSDRQFKDSASDKVPDGKFQNGWAQAEGYDARLADVAGANLLGARQETFLASWAEDFDHDAWMKVLLSQTPFVNVATIPEGAAGGAVLPSLPVPEPGAYPEGYKFAADTDSGGWPQTPRDRAVALLKQAGAVHLAGDQHLGSLVEYGIDEFRDGGFAFTSPAIANTWPRRWWPPLWGKNPEPDAPHYTGDFEDGFGNKLTVWAVANPVQSGREPRALYDRMPGYGIVRFSRKNETITFECWPRWVDPRAESASQYPGWPRTVRRADNL